MQLALRLYYPIDADLIAIRLREKRQFTSLIREKLTRLLDPSVEDLKEKDLYHIPDNLKNFVRNPTEPIRVNLNLMDGRDDIIINYMTNIKPSARGDTIKALFRMCYDSYRDDIFPMGLFLDIDKTCSARISAKSIDHKEIKKAKTVKIPVLEKQPVKQKPAHEVKSETAQSSVEIKEKSYITDPVIESREEKESVMEKVVPSEPSPVQNDSVQNDSIQNDSIQNDSIQDSDMKTQESSDSTDSTAYEMFQKLLGY